MAKKSRKEQERQGEVVSSILNDSPLTAQERRELELQTKADLKAERKAQRQELKAAMKESLGITNDRKQMTIILLVMIAFLVIVAIVLSVGGAGVAGKQPMEGRTYYIDQTALPERQDGYITASLNEVYYTQNGGLMVKMTLANDKPYTQCLTYIGVDLYNGDDQLIASGATDNIAKDYFITDAGSNTYELFIPKEYVKIADDSLETLWMEFTVESENRHAEDGQ